MPSASELFHISSNSSSRRSRYGLGSRHVTTATTTELGFPDSPSQEPRTSDRRRQNSNRRRDVDGGCDPPRRRLPRHHRLPSPATNNNNSVSENEGDTVRDNEGSGLSLANSSINFDNFIDARNRGRRNIGNDRLPGAVLLARERLLERLRGVSLSANRRSNRTSSRFNNRNGLIFGDDSYRVADTTGDHWDIETLRESFGRDVFTNSIFQIEQLSVTQETTNKRRPPGITENALARLQLEVFTEPRICDDGEKIIFRSSQECSICLENFTEGDELIILHCAHRFHFVCLEPWVRACGDCPYCRREIVVS